MSIFSFSKRERYEMYTKYECLINWVCVLFVLVVFAVFAYNFVFTSLSEEDTVVCEEIVHDVYKQKEQKAILYEVPTGYRIYVSETEIIAQRVGLSLGTVKLYVHNGELTIEKDNQEIGRIVLSILIGIVAALFKLLWLVYYNIKYGGPTKIIRFVK